MGKGLFVLAAVGALFAYFVYNFVGSIEEDDTNFYSSSRKKNMEYAKYYKKDAIGDNVLDLSGTSLSTAKAVWAASYIKKQILKNFPNFELMRAMVIEKIRPCAFRKFLIKVMNDVQNDFISGSISSEEAIKRLSNLEQ